MSYLKSADTHASGKQERTSSSGVLSDMSVQPIPGIRIRASTSAKEKIQDNGGTPPLSCPSCEFCLFCGTVIPENDTRKRCKTPASIREFVTDYCRPTCIVYPILANLQGERRLPLCIACVNWQRRCGQGQRKRCNGKKPMLLLDHFVMFMLEPGKTIVPDQRCGLRLVKALLADLDARKTGAPTSGVLELMPVQVQIMVSSLPKDICGDTLLPQLVKAWWEFNGRSLFFSHHLTAKLVRKMIKVF